MKLTGLEAIEYAEQNGLTLNKYEDPTEDARCGVDVDEARKIALEDPRLIWCAKDEMPGDIIIVSDHVEIHPTETNGMWAIVRDGRVYGTYGDITQARGIAADLAGAE